MSNRKSYRTHLASRGLVFLGNEELEMKIKNLSLTGVLAELFPGESVKTVQDVFNAISSSAIVDMYLPKLQLAGEVEVVRAEEVDGVILLGLEFKNIAYEVNDIIYKRKAYRKNMVAKGFIVLRGGLHAFETRNVSVEGLMIYLDSSFNVPEGLVTDFDFGELGLKGKIKVIWCDKIDDDSTLMGLQYISMQNTKDLRLPNFQLNAD
jgi:hypothetical protein